MPRDQPTPPRRWSRFVRARTPAARGRPAKLLRHFDARARAVGANRSGAVAALSRRLDLGGASAEGAAQPTGGRDRLRSERLARLPRPDGAGRRDARVHGEPLCGPVGHRRPRRRSVRAVGTLGSRPGRQAAVPRRPADRGVVGGRRGCRAGRPERFICERSSRGTRAGPRSSTTRSPISSRRTRHLRWAARSTVIRSPGSTRSTAPLRARRRSTPPSRGRSCGTRSAPAQCSRGCSLTTTGEWRRLPRAPSGRRRSRQRPAGVLESPGGQR